MRFLSLGYSADFRRARLVNNKIFTTLKCKLKVIFVIALSLLLGQIVSLLVTYSGVVLSQWLLFDLANCGR